MANKEALSTQRKKKKNKKATIFHLKRMNESNCGKQLVMGQKNTENENTRKVAKKE